MIFITFKLSIRDVYIKLSNTEKLFFFFNQYFNEIIYLMFKLSVQIKYNYKN